MFRYQFAVVTNFHEVHLCQAHTTQGMYGFLRWLVRLGQCDNFTVYICRLHPDSFFSDYQIDIFEDCYSDYPSFSVTVANGLEEMTENFQKRICGI